MGKLRSFLVFAATMSLIASCASESCHEMRNKKLNAKLGTVKVFKLDGSLQCNMGQKTPLETMAKELEGIPIVSMQNLSDGKLRTQVCGAPTGMANVYEISANDLEAARKKGFERWTLENSSSQ